jgi:hypothetical protein
MAGLSGPVNRQVPIFDPTGEFDPEAFDLDEVNTALHT